MDIPAPTTDRSRAASHPAQGKTSGRPEPTLAPIDPRLGTEMIAHDGARTPATEPGPGGGAQPLVGRAARGAHHRARDGGGRGRARWRDLPGGPGVHRNAGLR